MKYNFLALIFLFIIASCNNNQPNNSSTTATNSKDDKIVVVDNKNIQLSATDNLVFSNIASNDAATQYTYFIPVVPPLLILISTGVFVFHAPLVKSGTGMEFDLLATDQTESGETDDHNAAS